MNYLLSFEIDDSMEHLKNYSTDNISEKIFSIFSFIMLRLFMFDFYY